MGELKLRIWQPPDYLFINGRKKTVVKMDIGGEEIKSDLKARDIAQYNMSASVAAQKVATKVEVPNEGVEGWVKVYYVGRKHPIKGLVSLETSKAIHSVKKVYGGLFHIVSLSPIKWLVSLFFLFPPKIQDMCVFKVMIVLGKISEWILQTSYLESIHWTPRAKAFYKAIQEEIGERIEKAKTQGEKDDLVDISNFLMFFVCLFEYDDQYGFRWQDVMTQTDRHRLIQESKKEILSLIKLGANREIHGTADKWLQLYKLLSIVFTLRPKWAIITGQFLSKVGKADMDIEYTYNIAFLDDYNYGGKTYDERAYLRA